MGNELDTRLADAHLRPADLVMQPEMLGAARPTRYAFSRTLLRRAQANGWEFSRPRFEMNETGEGLAVYQVDAEGHTISFIAFTQTLPEDAHTDRVIAERWEICAALVDGAADDAVVEHARQHVTRQEEGRLDPRFLVLTRGNRSVRFFDRLIEDLAAGRQPDPDQVADAGYIMRSTAFYGNGKFGMRSFDGYAPEHPLAASFRAQFLAAFLYRELSYDVVEHCAQARGGAAAVGFDDRWRRFFGLGNATGLGLVPFFVHHPRLIHAWVGVRELALADVRGMRVDDHHRSRLRATLERARCHFATGADDDCTPFLSPRALVPVLDRLIAAWDTVEARDDALDAFYRAIEDDEPEAIELAVTALIELHEGDDGEIDALLRVDESGPIDHDLELTAFGQLLDQRFPWLDELALDDATADEFWWVISDNSDEPRRTRREALAPAGRDVAIDVALRVHQLRNELASATATTVAELLDNHPEHRAAVARVFASDRTYGEARDNVCAADYLPLQLQRFQLAMYGMENYKPKSTDWLRVTLFQGAPRADEVATAAIDDWTFPARPGFSS